MQIDWGMQAIAGRIGELTDQVKSLAKAAGYTIVTPTDPTRHGAMIALRCHDAPALVARLAEQGFVLSDRDNNLRISPHFYNNEQDIDQLFAALAARRELLA